MIYTVKEGDTLFGISRSFDVPPGILAADNGIDDPASLVVGEDLVVLPPSVIFTVEAGDTADGIAARFGITTRRLYRNNPALRGGDSLFPGQSLVISRRDDTRLGELSLYGYAYPFIDEGDLRAALPYLTYLAVFTHGIRRDGSLIEPEGAGRLVDAALDYGTVPVMMLTSLGEDGNFSDELVRDILSSDEASSRLIESAVREAREGGYGGIDVDFEYISGELAERYVLFLSRLRAAAGDDLPLFTSLAPKTSDDMPGILYEGHDYAAIGAVSDRVLLMTYEWGYTYGPPMAVAPLNKVREVAEYAASRIPADKIFLGMPNYGYDFKLPYIKGESKAATVSNEEALRLASERRSAIEYDPVAEAPFFVYYEREGGRDIKHVVWFESARSVGATGRLADELSSRGISIWNVMKFFPRMFLQLDSMFDIL